MSEITLQHLSVYYAASSAQPSVALRDVSLTFPAHSFSVLLGPSGSGKSTLLNAIAGNLLYEGTISFDGKNVADLPSFGKGLAYLSQSFVLYPHKNVYDNLVFPLSLAKKSHEESDRMVKEIAAEFGISFLLTRSIKELSRGQASKVALAKELLKGSKINLFDEPFQSLDEASFLVLAPLLKKRVLEHGGSGIYVTHSFKEALCFGNSFYVLKEGRFLGEFTKEALARSADPFMESLFLERGGQ